MHLDAKDPKNYVFGPTDYLLKRTREDAGLDIFYRLGTSIEHSGNKVHFNALIPEDFDKVAEIFAGTVRHYNCSWAKGFKWGIKYWEIWNEPEGIHNMWCPKEGVANLTKEQDANARAECRVKFVKFFVTVLKRLKSEFGDEIKVGGPALCSYNTIWLNDILTACKDADVTPDFISWHGYANDPMQYSKEAEMARKLCDGFGFSKCELIINEWHYFGFGDYSWIDMQQCSDPKVKARIWTGPKSHNGIHSACYTLAALAEMQRSKLSQAYFYGCRHTGAWGFKDENHNKYKVFYALKMFGDFVKGAPVMCASTSDATYTTLAVRDDTGRKSLLVVDYGGTAHELSVRVTGVKSCARVTCMVLDWTHNLDPHPVTFKDGVLSLRKTDSYSAAFVVTFDE